MHNSARVDIGKSSFDWSWIARSLLLKRKQAGALLGLTAVGYGAGLVFPVATQTAVDAIVAKRADLELAGLALLAVAAIGVEAVVAYWRRRLVVRLGAFLDRRISRRAFAHLMRIRIDGAEFRSGEAINHFQQATKIQDFVLHHVPHLVFDGGGALVALALAFYYDRVVGTMLILMTPLLVFAARKQLTGVNRIADTFYASISTRQNILSETVSGIGTVKALGLEVGRTRRWRSVTNAMISNLVLILDLNSSFVLRAQMASRIVTLLVLCLGCWRMLGGYLTVGELLALQLLAGRVTGPISAFGDLYRIYQEVDAAIRQIGDFLAQPRESASVDPPAQGFPGKGITLSHVSLTYPGAAQPALENVTFSLPAAGVVALVGRNGSGKSTLIQILLGLRRDYAGTVKIGGREVREYHPRWLRSQIAVVNQDTVLFSGTIRDNLAPGRHLSGDAQLRDALRFAGALDFVDARPAGLDEELSENGRSLSGGQRQRLSIARAIVRDPKIALFDEPTAFLDAEAAVALEKQLESWGRDRLLILVTHHLAAARNADRILVLDAGRLVGDGVHENLLSTTPEYASLWADYARSRELVAS